VCAVRKTFLKLLIVLLLYLKEYKALGVAMALSNIVGVLDAITTLRRGLIGLITV